MPLEPQHYYTSLVSEDEDKGQLDTPDVLEEQPAARQWQHVMSYLLHIGFAACIAFTAFNTYLVQTLRVSPTDAQLTMAYSYKLGLPRPNQFIGLENVNRTGSDYVAPRPFVNWPMLLTQVDSERVKYVFPDDRNRHFSKGGTVSPREKQFIMDKSISTIAQFRVLDFGMESCELVLNITTLSPAPTNPVPIAIYNLTVDHVLDPLTLSYRTKPQSTLLAVAQIGKETVAHIPPFYCASDSLQTFEVACAADARDRSACDVTWWQDTYHEMGIFIRQSSSL